MKRFISSLAATALLAVTIVSPVVAANVAAITGSTSPSTVSTLTVVTLTVTPTTALVNGSTIRVGIPAVFTGGASLLDADVSVTGTNITSTVESGFSATGFTSTLTTSGSVTTAVTITIGATNKLTTPATASTPAFTVTTSVGDIGAVLVVVANGNQVAVSATVDPVFTFSLTGNTVNFGSLNVTGDNAAAATSTLSFATNAAGGVVVSGTAVGGDTGATAGALGIAGTTNKITAIASETDPAAFVDANTYFAVDLLNLTATTGTVKADNAFSSLDNGTADRANKIATATPIVNSNATPVSGLFDVRYHIGITAATPAGSYSGTVTYTATPTF